MKKELIDSYIEVLKAIRDGKEWEVFANDKWEHPNLDIGDFMNEGVDVRVKPEPVTRPWSKPEDVPGPVCWLRHKKDYYAMALISGISLCGFSATGVNFHWSEIEEHEYSTDRKTWFPCTITE